MMPLRMPSSRARMPAALVALLAACAVSSAANCEQVGRYDGGEELDGGTVPVDTISAADIGQPCIYDPATGENPTSQCALGLECMIVTRDGRINTIAMTADAWEDHFSVYRDDGKDEGYCTRVGTPSTLTQAQCPAGTLLKFFSSAAPGGFSAACLRTCTTPSECGRGSYTCDTRFIDDNPSAPGTTGLCVRRCSLDVPECVRTGVLVVPPLQNSLQTVLLADDMFGASSCNAALGVCAPVPSARGTAGPGEPCSDTTQCAANSVCYQAPLLGGGAGTLGVCGSPCQPNADDPQAGCSVGFVCQAGLTLGLQTPILVDGNGQFTAAGGLCFPQCQATLDRCDAFGGTSCGAADEAAFGAPWNNVSMCLPASLKN